MATLSFYNKKEKRPSKHFSFYFCNTYAVGTFISEAEYLHIKDSYPPKLSYMMLSGSTPRESSIETTAFDIGPGPHI